jgi:hypothetical protein
VGNGGPLSNYGLRKFEDLKLFFPEKVYQPATENIVDGIHTPDKHAEGLIGLSDMGCNHEVCIVVSGDMANQVIYYFDEIVTHEAGWDLFEFYDQYLESELKKFDMVESLMREGRDYFFISDFMSKNHKFWGAGDYIASIADVAKPVSIFGWPGEIRGSGAEKFPWYDRTLLAWQQHQGVIRTAQSQASREFYAIINSLPPENGSC